MCNKNSPKISKQTIGPARRTRTKTRKPKYLSLRLELTPGATQQNSGDHSGDMNDAVSTQQLDLFPLHPENLVEEKDTQEENVDYLFSAGDGGGATLTGLLSGGECSEEEKTTSLREAYGVMGEESESDLVRTALRSKEREASEEEKWVSYAEVTTRCDAGVGVKRGLSLKLDYEKIMDAWSDKGPLYIKLESPQTVPDLHDDCFNGMGGWESNGGLWTVPESNYIFNGDKEVVVVGDDLKMGKREASMLRYKEKRQNRLFSKRIRYQVRKLNAEKRPRMKGRFVKRT